MKVKELRADVEIPEGLTVTVTGSVVAVKGEKGEVTRDFRHPKLQVSVDGNTLALIAKNATKREKMIVGTFKSHAKNMFKGAQEGHTYLLKVCSGHFPMNVALNGKQLVVKNFLGEKVPRVLDIVDGADVKVDGEVITVSGTDKEIVGQCAASIELLTRITNRDRRIFQDGIYITNKDGKDLQ